MFIFDYIIFKFPMLNVQINDKSKIKIFTKRVYVIKNFKIKFNVTNTNSSIKRMTKFNEIIKISIKFLIIFFSSDKYFYNVLII